MVIQNFAHTEYDLNTQELKVFSRHPFDKKGLKIVGAVSVIFVQPSGQNENVNEFQQTVDEVSSSLSVITLPDFTGESNRPQKHASSAGYRAGVTLPENHVNTRTDEFVNSHNVSIIDFSKQLETSSIPQHANHSSSDNAINQIQNVQGHVSNQKQNIQGHVSNQIQNVPGYVSNQTPKPSNPLSTSHGTPTNIINIDSREVEKAIGRINNKQTYSYQSNVKKQDKFNLKSIMHAQERKVHLPVKSRPKPMRIKALVVTKEKKYDVNCGICQVKLESCTDIMAHSKQHNLELACCVCEASFASYCNMRRHCAGHVQTINYMCSLCHCAYKRKDNLQTHIKKHYMQAGVPTKSPVKYPYMRTYISKDSKIENQNKNHGRKNALSNDLPIMQSNMGNALALTNSVPEYQSFKGSNNLSNSVDSQIDLTSDDEQMRESDKIVEKESCEMIDISQNQEESVKASTSIQIEEEMSQIHESEVVPPVEDKIQEDGSTPPNQILNYSCSSCNIQFDQVESLKRHILSCHSEEIQEHLESSDNSNVTNSDFIKIEMFEEANNSENPCTGNGQQIVDIGNNSGNPCAGNGQQIVDIGNLMDYSNRYTSLNQTDDISIGDSHSMTFSPNSSLASATNALGNMNYNSSPKPNKSFKKRRQGDRLGSATPICKICGIMFKDIQQVLDHKSEHPTEIPHLYGCTICNADLSSKECLRRHIRNHLGEEHQCYYCPCKYSRTDNLYAHMKNAHGWVKPKTSVPFNPYYKVYPLPQLPQ